MWWGNWNTGILKLTTAEHTHSGKARSQTQVSAPSSCPSAPHGGLFSSMKSLGSVLTLIITIQRVDLCYHNLLKRGGARVLAERGGLQWESVPLSILWRSWQGYVGTPQIFTEQGGAEPARDKDGDLFHLMESWKVWTKCFFKSEKPTYSGSGMRFADWISFHELSTKLMYLYNFFPGSHFKTRLFHFTCNQHILWLLSIWRFLTWLIFLKL